MTHSVGPVQRLVAVMLNTYTRYLCHFKGVCNVCGVDRPRRRPRSVWRHPGSRSYVARISGMYHTGAPLGKLVWAVICGARPWPVWHVEAGVAAGSSLPQDDERRHVPMAGDAGYGDQEGGVPNPAGCRHKGCFD